MKLPTPNRRALLIWAALLCSMGCGGAVSTTATPETARPGSSTPETTTGSASTNGTTSATGGAAAASPSGTNASPSGTSAPAPLSSVPECDTYLRLYQRCEPALVPAIAAGDRRDFEHERGWLEYIASTPEVASMPESCRAMTRELQAVCP